MMRALEAGDRDRRLEALIDGGTVAACSWPLRSISVGAIMAMLHA